MAYRNDSDARHPYTSPNDRPYRDRDQDRDNDFPRRTRSRADSLASDYQPRDKSPGHGKRYSDAAPPPAQQPLKNAIGNAFDKSDTARVVDPDLIAQITEEVKKSVLNEIKLASQQQPTTPVSPQYHVPPSPASTSTSIPVRDVYTPPSTKQTDFRFQTSPPRDPVPRDLDGKDDTPTPRVDKAAPTDIPSARPLARPPPAPRMATDDYTPIEKMWQRLFDPDGRPLPRLGEFLRGLALHLIEDYEPKKSLVISPAKMLKFYQEVRLQDEIYPWPTIFGKLSYSALSKIYRDMRCQHHFVQEHPSQPPDIPALTPDGFQEWMTAMIQAYPDMEYERLTKVVLDMPISNAEDRKERFPKELPRRLLPSVENLQAQQRCAAALSAEGVGPLRKAPSFPPPPPKTQPPLPNGPTMERKRSPYVSRPEVKPFDPEDEPLSASVPLERERKPYSATPGAGKMYEDNLCKGNDSEGSDHAPRKRAQSTSNQGPFAPPPPEDRHHPPRAGSQANAPRPRSPGISGYGTSSESSLRDIPSSYYTSNLHSFDDDTHRYSKDTEGRRYDRHRRSTAGVDNSFDSQSRSIYEDDDYRGRGGSNGYENRNYDSRRY
ncbi:hypothetical protein ACN47E_005866 [Coniothyrium glycines]